MCLALARWTAVAASCAVAGCGGGNVKSLADLQQASQMQIEIAEGAGQTIDPGKPFEGKVRFRIKDTVGRPIAKTPVAMRLIDVTGVAEVAAAAPGDATAAALLRTAWDAKERSIAADESPADETAPDDQIVGLIIEQSPATDGQGYVEARVQASKRHGRAIAIVARVDSGAAPNVGGGLSWVVLSTKAIGESVSSDALVVIVNNKNEVVAGKPFPIKLKILGLDAATRYNAPSRLIEFESAVEGQAPLGAASVKPAATFTCAFAGGECELPGGPFVFDAAGLVTLKIGPKSPDFPFQPLTEVVDVLPFTRYETLDLIVNDGQAVVTGKEVPIRLKIDGRDAAATYDGKLAKFDLEMSYEGEVGAQNRPPASFECTLANAECDLPGTPFVFDTVGFVTIRVRSLNPDLPFPPLTKVVRVEQSARYESLLLTVNGEKTVVDSKPFEMRLIIDGKDASAAYDGRTGKFELNYEFENPPGPATKTPDRFIECRFVGAECTIPGGPFVLATQGFVTIRVASRTPEMSFSPVVKVLKVDPSIPTSVMLSYRPWNESLEPICADGAPNNDFAKPCVRLSADASEVKVYGVLLDQAGDPIGSATTTWAIASGPLSVPGGLAAATVDAVQTLRPVKAGKGQLSVATPEGLTFGAYYEVYPGRPARYELTTTHAYKETATAPFDVSIELFDRKDNACVNFDGSDALVLTLEGASPSPGGQAPVTRIEKTVSFVEGKATVGQLHAVKAGEKPILKIAGSLGSAEGGAVEVSYGPTTHVKLRDASGGDGEELLTPIRVSINESFSLYVAGYDDVENFTGDAASTFAGTGVIAYQKNGATQYKLSGSSGSAVTIIPSKDDTGQVGKGKVVVMPEAPGVTAVESPEVTITSSNAVRLAIKSEHNNTEPAGQPFKIRIHALDSQGVDATAFEGDYALDFVVTADPSWAGDVPTLPTGSVTCTFVAGVCELPGDYTVVNAVSPAILSVQEASDQIPDLWSTFLTATKGTGTRLRVADKVGGPAAGAKPAEKLIDSITSKIEMTADDTLGLAAAIVDAGGNFVADAPAATAWSGAGTPAAAMDPGNFSATTGAAVVFDAAKVGSGTITASHSGYAPGTSPTIEVRHGLLHHVRVLDNVNGTNAVEPGTCFTVDITMQDSDHNTVTSYNMSNLLTLTWLDATSGVPVYYQPSFIVSGQRYNTTWSGSVGILNGEVNTQNIAYCLYDATSVAPKLQVAFPAKNGHAAISSWGDPGHTPPDVFSIAVGEEDHIFYSSDAGDTGNFPCAASSFFGGHCRDYNVDAGPVTLYAHVHDKGGNYIRTATGNWSSNTGAVQAELTNTTGTTNVTLGNRTATSGTIASLHFAPTDGTAFAGSTGFRIQPGVPTHVALYVNGGAAVKANTPWYASVYLRDQYENTTGFGTARDVSWSFDGTAHDSPAGNPPVLPGGVTGYTFPNGYYQSPTSFRTRKAHETVTLRVTVNGFPSVTANVAVAPGTPTKAVIYDLPSISGAAVGALNLISTDEMYLYGCALDVEENFYGCGIDGSWVGSYELSGRLIPSAGTTSRLNPYQVTSTVGYGVVTFTPNDVSIQPGATGNIVVGNGPLARFEVDKVTGTWGDVDAGVPFTLELRAVDANDNDVVEFDGSHFISWSVSNNGQTAEGYGSSLPPSQAYDFVDGVCTDIITATLYNAQISPRIDVNYNNGSTNYYGNTRPFSGLSVAAGAPHHYGVFIDTASNNADARSDLSATFPVRIQMRDLYGNPVCCGEAGINLEMTYTNGTAANGTLSGTLATSLAGQTTVSISDLAYDIGGSRKLRASSAAYTTPTNATETINFQTSRYTVKDYSIVPVATVTAGVPYPFQVRARDNAGNAITGADADLASLEFAWSGPLDSPSGQAPSLPSTLAFIAGVATPPLTFYKAETVAAASLTITDDQSVPKSGIATGSVTVLPGPLTQYQVDASHTTRTADASGLFDVTIRAYDDYLNPRSGDSALTLIPVRVLGVANVGTFGGAATSGLNAAAGVLTVSGIHYNVPHVISFGLSGTSATVSQSDQISFTPTIHTVKSYGLTQATSVTAGNGNLAVTTRALDGGGNVIDDAAVDAALNLQSYCWSGAGTSPAPMSVAPVYDTSPAFANGETVFTHSLRKAETLALNALVVQDNYAGSCGPTRQGRNAVAITVAPATASSYELVAVDGLAQTAGVGFDIRVRALDPFSNVDTNWAADDLTFTWSGTTATPATPNDAGGQTAQVFSAGGNEAFSSGLFTTSTNPFVLYREADAAPVLSVAGASIPGPYTLSGFSLTHAPTVDFVKIFDASAAELVHTAELTTHAMTTDETKQVWAHGYDQWANYIGLQSVAWSGTGVLGANDVPAGPATSTIVSPDTIGTGTVVADHASAADDATGTFTINPGVITKLVILQAPSVTQDSVTCGIVDIQSRDAEENPSPVSATKTVNLSTSAPLTGTFYSDASCTSSITATTIASGQHTKRVYYNDTLVGARTLTVAESPSAGWIDASLAVTVVPGPIVKLAFTSAALHQTSGVCGEIAFQTRDVHDNASAVAGATTVTLASSYGSGTFHATSACGAVVSSATIASGQTSGNAFYKDAAVGLPILTIDESPSSGWTAATQQQAINPGSFSIDGPSSPTNANPPTVTWTASAGTPTYQLKVDDAASCASPQQTHAAVSGASQLLGAIPDGNYYVCVTALGNGADDVAATNSGSYQFQVDITPPAATTSLLTAADGAGGADVRYDDDTAVFFRWSASTDNLSGVASYKVHHYAQTACGGTATVTAPVTATDYQLASATHGTSYSFKVETFDSAGNSTLSACSPAILVDTVSPAAATGLVTAADSAAGADVRYDDDTTIYLVWAAATDATSAIRDYTVTHYAQPACGGAGTVVSGIAGTSHVLSGAANHTTYSFKVTAYDMAGNATISGCSGDIFVDTTAPVAATSLVTAADSAGGSDVRYDDDTTVYFAWSAATDVGGAGVASYTLHRYAQAACGGASTDTAGIAPGAVSASFASGVNGSTYSFRIRAYDNAGNSTLSACSGSITIDTSAPTTSASALAIAADSAGGATASYDDDTTVYFKWTAAADNVGGTGIKEYTLHRYAQASCGGVSVDTTGVTGTSTSFAGGVDGTTYSFKLTAYDYAGNAGAVSACSTSIMVDTTPPATAASLVTAADSAGGGDVRYDDDTTIYFAWTAATDVGGSGVASYTLHRYAQAACGGTSTDTSGLSAATLDQSYSGSNGTTYSFKVTALDNAGNATTSACSGDILVDTTAPAAASLLVTAADSAGGADVRYDDDTTIYVAWAAATDSGGIASYTLRRYDLANCGGAATDTAGLSSATSSQSFAGAADGTTYSFKVTAYDNAGNSTTSACSGNITVDTSAPTTTASSLVTAADAAGGSDVRFDNDTTVYFAWTAAADNGGGSGIKEYTVHRYSQAACGGASSDVANIAATSYAHAAGSQGTYSFKVTAYDQAGNAGAVSACSGDIQVDTTAPVAATSLVTAADSAGGADARYDDDTTVYFTWSAATDVGGSGVASYTLHRYAQAACGGTAADTAGLSAATLDQSYTGSNGTTYSFKVTAIDNAGNATTSACSGNILIDTTAPVAASSLVTAADSAGGSDVRYDDDTTIYFSWSAATDSGGVASYTLHRYDLANCGGAATDTAGLSSATSSQSFGGAANGTTYSFKVTAYDNAGNATTSACSANILIDTTVPVAATSLVTAADSAGGGDVRYDDDTSIYFAWAAATDTGGSGVATYTLHRYGQAACAGASTDTSGIAAGTTSLGFASAADGTTYSFKVTAYDNAGNSTTSACSGDITVDTTAPVATSSLVTAADSAGGSDVRYDDDTSIYFAWAAATDTGGSGVATYTVHRYGQATCAGASTDTSGIAGGTTSLAFASAADGSTYSFKVTAYDNAGNSTTSACSGNITVDTSAPTTTASSLVTAADAAGGSDARFDNDTTVYFAWTAAADNGGGSGIKEYTVHRYSQAACGGASSDVANIAATSYAHAAGGQGTYSFKVTAYDQAGNAGAVSACSGDIQVDTTAPVAATSLVTAADSAGGSDVRYDDDTTVYFTWSAATDVGGSGVASYTLHRYAQAACGGTAADTAGLSAATLDQSYTGSNGTTYSFKVTAIDNAGNATTSACSADILIDTTAPVAASSLVTAADSAGGSDVRYDDDTTIYFSWSAATDSGGVASYTLHRYDLANCGGAATDTTGLSSATSSQSFVGAVNGTTYSFKVAAYDNAGNSTTSACSGNIMVDTSAPTTTASSLVTAADAAGGPDVRFDNDTTVYFAWTAAADNGGGSGIKEYTVHRYSQAACGGVSSDVANIATTSHAYAASGEGIYSFKVTAYDQAGNSGVVSACSDDIQVDTTAPVAASSLVTAADSAGGADVRYDDDATVYFAWAAATDVGGSGVASYTLHRYAQAACGGTATDTAGLSAATLDQSYTGGDGMTYSFKVTAIDNAGNATTSACSADILIDTMVPVAASSLVTAADAAGGADVRYDDDTTIYFAWAAATDSGGVASYTLLRYDLANCGGAATDTAGLSSATSSQSFAGAVNGTTYSFKVTAYDNAGNSTTSTCSGNIAVDTTAPVAASSLVTAADSAGGADVRHDDDTSIYFAWAAATDAGGSGVATYTLHRYGQGACAGSSTDTSGIAAGTTSLAFASAADGATYSFKVTAYDNAGNSTISACSGDITVDTTAPVAASSLVTAADSAGGADVRYDDDTTIYFAWAAATDAGGIASYTLHRYDLANCGGAATDTTGLSSATSSQSFAGAANGSTYSFKVTAYDDAGNSTTSTCSGNIAVDTTAPVATSSLVTAADSAGGADVRYDDDTTIYFAWAAATDSGGIASYTLHRYDLANCGGTATDTAGLSSATSSQSFAGAADGTTYSFKVTAYDNAGNATTSACSASILIDTTAPVAASLLVTAADSAGGADVRYDDDTTIYFAWAAATDSGGIASYTLRRYDLADCGGAATDTTGLSSATSSQTLAGAANGTTYSFKVIAYDNAGNSTSSACSGNITIDITAPVAASALITAADSAGGADVRYDDDTTVYFAWTAATDAIGIASYTLHRYDQAACGGSATDTAGIAAGTLSQSFSGSDGGTYSFKVSAIDHAGNSTLSSCSGGITIDTTPPAAFSITAPTASSTTSDDTPAVAWTDPGDAAHYGVRADDSDSDCSTAEDSHDGVVALTKTLSALADGTWYICVTAFDAAGNSTPATNSGLAVTISTGVWMPTDVGDTDLPAARRDATAVWTGTKLVVWGGYDGSGSRGDGGRYDPSANDWMPVATAAPAPSARRGHSAVWTGSSMIVFGGYDGGSNVYQDGGLYDPGADAWTATDASDGELPDARYGHTAVWTGSKMIVWGGYDGSGYRDDGGIYNPAGPDYWEAVDASEGDRPSARYGHTAVWTGSRMIVWGGYDGAVRGDGAMLDPTCPSGDCWRAMDADGAPEARFRHTAIWTGAKMIVFGGFGASALATGAVFDPDADGDGQGDGEWTPLTATDAPAARQSHAAVWDAGNAQMYVVGGLGATYLASGAAFKPGTGSWTIPSLESTDAPSARSGAAAVWTGSAMVIWGGFDGSSYLQTGGRFTPP